MAVIIKNENIYDESFKRLAYSYALDWLLLKAQVKQESRFNPKAVSPVGAKGLAQFMPPTWKEWGRGDVFDPEQNLLAQAKYMNWLMHTLKGNKDLALAAYNWGIGRIQRLIREKGTREFEKLKEFMPAETQIYVAKINKYYNEYKEFHYGTV